MKDLPITFKDYKLLKIKELLFSSKLDYIKQQYITEYIQQLNVQRARENNYLFTNRCVINIFNNKIVVRNDNHCTSYYFKDYTFIQLCTLAYWHTGYKEFDCTVSSKEIEQELLHQGFIEEHTNYDSHAYRLSSVVFYLNHINNVMYYSTVYELNSGGRSFTYRPIKFLKLNYFYKEVLEFYLLYNITPYSLPNFYRYDDISLVLNYSKKDLYNQYGSSPLTRFF